jgi:hypothetical protein
MKLFLFCLFFLCILAFSRAHEVCIDLTNSANYVNSYCSEYSGDSCCTPEKDAQIRDYVESLFADLREQGADLMNCPDLLRRAFCAFWYGLPLLATRITSGSASYSAS